MFDSRPPFPNLPEAVFDGAAEFQARCDKKKQNGVLVLPVVWPCDDDFGIVKDYWDDQKAADASAFSLARVLGHFLKWREDAALNPADDPCPKRVNLLAHSMGNRVLRERLWAWDKYDPPHGVPLLFRNTYLVAADIEDESVHRGQTGELISHASRNGVVCFASDDLALRSSKAANPKTRSPRGASATPGRKT